MLPPELRFYGLNEFVDDQAVDPEGENWGGLARGDVIRPMNAVLKLTHNDDPADTIGPEFEASLEVRLI